MNKTIFALDSSTKSSGACIMQGRTILSEEHCSAGLTHSQTLLFLVQRVFEKSGLSVADIDICAVVSGPGSFTGLRIGMALAKGLFFSSSTRMMPVSTLHAIAACTDIRGTVVSALDARRAEVYWSAFSCDEHGAHRLTGDAATPVSELSSFLRSACAPVFFLGDGAYLCYDTYGDFSSVKRYDGADVLPIARGAAILASKASSDLVLPQNVVPSYLRLSQAERERRLRLANTLQKEADINA